MVEEKQQWLEMRCTRCGRKLGEFVLNDGSIRILCVFNPGHGLGACKTLNTVTVAPKNNDTYSQDAI